MTHAQAINVLVAIAAELVRCEGIDDHELPEFRPMTRMQSKSLRREQIDRAIRMKAAIEVLRKEQPDFRTWDEDDKRNLLPKLRDADVVATIICNQEDIDSEIAVELGVCILLNKPIVAVVRPGSVVSEKLSRVVDRFVEMNATNMNSTTEGIIEAIKDLMK